MHNIVWIHTVNFCDLLTHSSHMTLSPHSSHLMPQTHTVLGGLTILLPSLFTSQWTYWGDKYKIYILTLYKHTHVHTWQCCINWYKYTIPHITQHCFHLSPWKICSKRQIRYRNWIKSWNEFGVRYRGSNSSAYHTLLPLHWMHSSVLTGVLHSSHCHSGGATDGRKPLSLFVHDMCTTWAHIHSHWNPTLGQWVCQYTQAYREHVSTPSNHPDLLHFVLPLQFIVTSIVAKHTRSCTEDHFTYTHQ